MDREAIARQWLMNKKELAGKKADKEREEDLLSQASQEEIIRAITNYHQHLNYAGKLFSSLKHQGPRSVKERKAFGFDTHEKHKITVIDLGVATLDTGESVDTRAILTDSFYWGQDSARHGRQLAVGFKAKNNSDPDASYEFVPNAHYELKGFPIDPIEALSRDLWLGKDYEQEILGSVNLKGARNGTRFR